MKELTNIADITDLERKTAKELLHELIAALIADKVEYVYDALSDNSLQREHILYGSVAFDRIVSQLEDLEKSEGS